VEGVIDADIKGNFQGKMQVSVDTILPGRQGQITENPSAGENRLEMKDEDVIDAESGEENGNGGDAPGTEPAENEKGGGQHE
jgi:hypothetical protein